MPDTLKSESAQPTVISNTHPSKEIKEYSIEKCQDTEEKRRNGDLVSEALPKANTTKDMTSSNKIEENSTTTEESKAPIKATTDLLNEKKPENSQQGEVGEVKKHQVLELSVIVNKGPEEVYEIFHDNAKLQEMFGKGVQRKGASELGDFEFHIPCANFSWKATLSKSIAIQNNGFELEWKNWKKTDWEVKKEDSIESIVSLSLNKTGRGCKIDLKHKDIPSWESVENLSNDWVRHVWKAFGLDERIDQADSDQIQQSQINESTSTKDSSEITEENKEIKNENSDKDVSEDTEESKRKKSRK